MIIGLTGGIASGKSTVSNMFRELGAYVVDADQWARRVVEPGSEALREICQAFGDHVLDEQGQLNRALLAKIVFQDAAAREVLNRITHPRVRQGMREETQTYWISHPRQPVIWDVPLLFEGETRQLVDKTIVVYVDMPTQLSRLMARNKLSKSDAEQRIQSQMPIDEKKQLADIVIDNGGALSFTREQVQRVWRDIQDRTDTAHHLLS